MMKKLFFTLFSVVLLSSCSSEEVVLWQDSVFYELEFTDEGIEKYYFKYPEGSFVKPGEVEGTLTYEDCKVSYAKTSTYNFERLNAYEGFLEKERNELDGSYYEAWYSGDLLIAYLGVDEDLDFAFWSFDEATGVVGCIDLVEFMTSSLTNKPIYYNDEYGFSVQLLEDYEVENMSTGNGVLMRKMVELENVNERYEREIIVSAVKNDVGYQDLAEFIANEYTGFETEFVDHEGFYGVYINQSFGKEAVRHFFAMSDDKSVIYMVNIRVPSLYFGSEKDILPQVVETMTID